MPEKNKNLDPKSYTEKKRENVFIFCVTSFNAFWKFLKLGNLAWDFFRLVFGPG